MRQRSVPPQPVVASVTPARHWARGQGAVTEVGTAFEAARRARDASVILVDCSLPGTDMVDAIALFRRAAGGLVRRLEPASR